jgi:predicted DNA binding protein
MTEQQVQDGATAELEFSVEDEGCFFVAASERAACRIVGQRTIQRTDGNRLEFFRIRGASPERLLDVADEYGSVTGAQVVERSDDEHLLAVVVAGRCVAATLADTAAVIKRAEATGGDATVVADVPPYGDVRHVVETFTERHPDSSLVSKHTLDEGLPAVAESEQSARLEAELTDKQRQAIATAVQFGYLSWPRESTATECADALDVSQPTFSQHLWTGVEKLLSRMFDEGGRAAAQ